MDNNRHSYHVYSSCISIAVKGLHVAGLLQIREFTTPCSIHKKLTIPDLFHIFRTICLLFYMRS